MSYHKVGSLRTKLIDIDTEFSGGGWGVGVEGGTCTAHWHSTLQNTQQLCDGEIKSQRITLTEERKMFYKIVAVDFAIGKLALPIDSFISLPYEMYNFRRTF